MPQAQIIYTRIPMTISQMAAWAKQVDTLSQSDLALAEYYLDRHHGIVIRKA